MVGICKLTYDGLDACFAQALEKTPEGRHKLSGRQKQQQTGNTFN